MDEFEYQVRSNEQWERRLNQSSSDFDHYTKDEYRMFTPQKGENHIRILPPSNRWKGAPHYGLDCYAHFGVGPSRSSVVCLDQGAPQIGRSGDSCPICQERARLMRAGDEDAARELRPVKRVLTFVLNRKEERNGQGVLLWGMPFTLDQQISSVSRDRSNGTWYVIDRPKDGYDIYFKRDGEQLLTKYSAVERDARPSEVDKRWVDWVNAHPLPETIKWRSYEETKRIYEGRSRGENDEGGVPADNDPPPPRNGGNDGRRRAEAEAERERPPRYANTDTEEQPKRSTVRRPRSEPVDEMPAARETREDVSAAEDDPPFDGGRPVQSPSGNGGVRADEVRARFMKRRG